MITGSRETKITSRTNFSKLRWTTEFAEQIAQHGHRYTQPIAAENIERNEAAVAHVGHARDEGRKGTDHGDELGVDDGLAAVLVVERIGAPQVLLLEEARIGPVEDRRLRRAGRTDSRTSRPACRRRSTAS